MDIAVTAAYLESLLAESNTRRPPLPEFTFSTSSCNACNGFYGPNFGEPVCSTCHAFLFPAWAADVPSPHPSEEGDDADSGNDEPADSRGEYPVVGVPALPLLPLLPMLPALPSLEERLELLSDARRLERNDSGHVENLPPEVLLSIFRYLDDLSLCSISMVCTKWREVSKTPIAARNWKHYMLRRWPLFKPLMTVDDERWFNIYRSLVTSCFCYTCLIQMAVKSQPLEEGNQWRCIRLKNELKIMNNDPLEGIAAIPLDDEYCHWQAAISGPIGSPYEGGLFYLSIQVPYSYPIKPPVVRFLTKILHPNVSRHGDIGVDSIHHNWSVVLTISKVLISVQSLLTDPNTKVCMEPLLGDMYINERKKFENLARQWTWKYAMQDCLYKK